MPNTKRTKAHVLQGTLDLMVLQSLARRRQLAAEKAGWDRMASIMHALLHDQA
jgi:hypothetical protein